MRTETCPVLLVGMNSQLALGLPAVAPSDIVVINARCAVRTEADQRVIGGGGCRCITIALAMRWLSRMRW